MRTAALLALAAVLAVLQGCDDDDSKRQPPGGDMRAQKQPPTTPRPGSTGAPEASPDVGDALPTSPPKTAPGKRLKAPTVRFGDGRCTPRVVRVGKARTLSIRNQTERSMRFQIRSIGADIPVRPGGSRNLFLPAGRREYVCRSGTVSAEGVLDVPKGGR